MRAKTSQRVYFSTCIGIFCLFSISTFYIFNVIYRIKPNPYIDETFHIPQAQKYCNGLFHEWDSKITTLPGLYLITLGIVEPLSLVFGTDFCNVYGLRMVNVSISLLNLYLLYTVRQKLHWKKNTTLSDKWKDIISAFNLAVFPVLYFFTFFYYTDTLSTLFVLLTYLLHVCKQDHIAALTGCMAVVTRQTNITWVALFAFDAVIEFLKAEAITRKKTVSSKVERNKAYLKVLYGTVKDTCEHGIYNTVCLTGRILVGTVGYIIVGLLFVVFVYVNGSIVVGDKSAHFAVINLPQIFYYALFVLIFSFPFCVVQLQKFMYAVIKQWKIFILLLILCIIVVHFNTLVHPYLLADNRHYTFYVWKRVFQKPFVPYLLCPLYLYSLFCLRDILKATSFTFQLSYFACVFLSVVPQKLLEFRYFIIPFMLFRLQIKSPAWWQLLLETLLYVFVNILTIYLFLTKTFYWSDSKEPQRIIW